MSFIRLCALCSLVCVGAPRLLALSASGRLVHHVRGSRWWPMLDEMDDRWERILAEDGGRWLGLAAVSPNVRQREQRPE